MSTFPHSLILRLGLKAFGGSEFGGYAPLPAPVAEVRTDSRRMRVYGICTTETVDRSREIVVADGVDWSEYRNNPICTINHGWREPEKLIGHAKIDHHFTPKKTADGRGWEFGCQFIQHGPQASRAAEAFALVDTGVLRGVSLGFRFLGAHSSQIVASDGQPALRIDRCSPFEITFLPVPDNPDAVVHVVEKGVNGRRLSQHWLDLLQPMVPKAKLHGFITHKREKAMAQPMPDPAAQQADPAQMQQQQQPPSPASQLPQVKPSIAMLMAVEQYTMGFIKFLKQQGEVQDHPEIKTLIGGLILHLSQAYRALSTTHQKIQSEDPTYPNLLGHGGLLAPDPAPPMPGVSDAGVAGQPGAAPQPGFGDGLDDVTGPEINAGMEGMDTSAPMIDSGGPMDGVLTDEDLGDAAQGTTDYGDVGDEDGLPDQSMGQMGMDDDQPMAQNYGQDDDDQDEDEDDEENPMKKRTKGYNPPREDQIILVREKGLPVAFERARRMLEAYENSLKRDFQGSDLNVLRWAADNVGVMTPAQRQQFAAWCREKAMQGIARKPQDVKPPEPGTPEFFAAVEAETRRLVEAARIKQ